MTHLVGSVPMDTAEAVMRAAADDLAPFLDRIPDGETGPRRNWLGWQRQYIAACPAVVSSSSEYEYGSSGQRFRLRPGWARQDLAFDTFGYAASAISSFETFRILQAQGIIPERIKFQISIPTPLAITAAYFELDAQEAVAPAIEDALRRDIERILSSISHDKVALQWDVAVEFAILHANYPIWFSDHDEQIRMCLRRLSAMVPQGVRLGYHLCFGDSGHKHFAEPDSLAPLVAIANTVALDSTRAIDWFHMPVPRDRTDHTYFKPLQALETSAFLYLGLIHMTDGYEGALKRITRAREYREDFGVATECGFGRRSPSTIAGLFDLHRRVCANL